MPTRCFFLPQVYYVLYNDGTHFFVQMFDNIRSLDLYVDHSNRPVAAKMFSAEGEV